MIERIFRANFDSWLNTSGVGPNTNADLHVIIRVFLRRCEPTYTRQTVSDYDGRQVPIEPWSVYWSTWWRSFEAANERFWDNRIWLQPQGYWGVPRRGSSGPGFIPNVRCNLDLQVLQTPEHAHLTINCYRVRTGEQFRAHTSGRVINIHSDYGSPESQIVSAHEIGHYLGLWHVSCPGNEPVCYGRTPEEMANLMGRGNHISAWHAHPWLCRLPQHVDGPHRNIRWKPTLVRPAPGLVPAQVAGAR